jgi:tryptophanyl-tRNA synthetase (EC 6.1.1.2)
MSARTRVLTGITTTGTPHLGNYVGAIRPALRMARDAGTDAFFFLADYHALIKCDDPERVAGSRMQIACAWLACGSTRSASPSTASPTSPRLPSSPGC